jgi:putative oxidoreductase
MIDVSAAPWAALLLRVSLGILFLAHGLLKLLVFKPAGTYGYFKSLGLPGGLAYVTIATVHGRKGWMFSNKDGGWEFPAFWAVALFVQFLLGDGAFALLPSPHWF